MEKENQQPPVVLEVKRKPNEDPIEPSPSKRLALQPLELARIKEAPDHTHLSLASEAVKRRLSHRLKQTFIGLQPTKPDFQPIVEKCDTLSNPPAILIPRSSPVPKYLCGPDDEGETMFGVVMEYHLLNLLEPNLAGGNFLNIASWQDDRHPLIDQSLQQRESLGNSETLNFKLAAWGRKAAQLEKVWDGSLKDLYSKKTFLSCGLYANKYPSETDIARASGPYYSDEHFEMSLPQESVFDLQIDFDLSHDLYHLIDISGGAKDVRRNHIVAAPSDFVQLTENIFVDRKPRKFVEAPICMCIASGDPACGESCLNRCMFIECTPDCPSGEQCTNRRFQTPNSGKSLQVVRCHGRGYGIQSPEPISIGEFIIEYRGEIINASTSKERMNSLYHASSNHYFLNYGPQEVIDGYLKGTIARFANHSCDPNCAIEKWTVDGEYRIGLFSLKEIEPGTELTYDYKFESFGPLQKCLCQSSNCRGFIGLNKKEDDPTHQVKPTKSIPVSKKLPIKKGKIPFGNEVFEEDDDELLVYKSFDKMTGAKVLQAAIRAARTSFARGSFLIRNMKRQLVSAPNPVRRSISAVVEDIYLDRMDLSSQSTFVLTYKGSFHVAATSRVPMAFQTSIALKRNFKPKSNLQKSLSEILQSLSYSAEI